MIGKPPDKKEEKPKAVKVDDQPEYQEKIMFLVSTSAQGFILLWCLCVLSLGYIKLPTSMFGVEIPDQPRIDSTFAAGLLGNILAGWGISVGGNGSKKKKKEDEQMALGNAAGQQTIVIKQPIELITKQPTATRLNDLDRL
tara:strand:- start:125 stop:547 length:423 start_codon:yes stop_codon:yes gene_type:complete